MQVLFVDDDRAASRNLIRNLARLSPAFSCHALTTAADAEAFVATEHPAVVVVDLELDRALGPASGLSLISSLLKQDPLLRILVLTGHTADEFGIQALQAGATSFLRKPVDLEQLAALLRDALDYVRLRRAEAAASTNALFSFAGLSSQNQQMQQVLRDAAYAASNSQPLLIVGETGTGKGILAQLIHRSSSRKAAPFIRFQPSFGSPDLISSELFGHSKGAFTGATEQRVGLLEEANNGSFFLDEVAELPQETQLTLLHVLQEKVLRRVGSNKDIISDFRLIAATNRPLDQLLDKKHLREDFFHRIAHFTISLPPLRARPEDIEALALDFLRQVANRENLNVYGFRDQALARLRHHLWPGNIRELQAVIEGSVYHASYQKRTLVDPSDLSLHNKTVPYSHFKGSFRERVRHFEQQLVREALLQHNNNQVHAAESLSLDRSTFRRILKRR